MRYCDNIISYLPNTILNVIVSGFHERDARLALGVCTCLDSSLFALNIKSPLCQLKCQCPISIAEMVGGRRRGRLVDAEETSNERDQQQPKPTPASVELGVMDPGPGDALVGLTSGRRPPCRINKQALASRYTRVASTTLTCILLILDPTTLRKPYSLTSIRARIVQMFTWIQ